jgi:CheY-like chemotaxis protein
VVDGGFPVALVVEDAPAIRYMLEAVLRQHGVRVHGAGSCDEALVLARIECPDVVLLDLLVPGMRSDVFLDAFRALPGGDLVPVIVLSGLSGGLAAALTCGAQAYIPKPFDMADVLPVVARQLAARRRALDLI